MTRMNGIKKIVGVTLLEIMLVLAIAAMIIIMSVRYYQATSQSQQLTSILQTVQAITAAADTLTQGAGTYSSLSTSTLINMVPNGLMTPWDQPITVVQGTATGLSYT